MPLPPDLSRLIERRRPPDVFARLMAQDDALAAKGFPRMSPWWVETLRAFYGSGRRQLVLRVGRRGGKSSTLCRVAVAEALAGGHEVPPGDVGYFAFISVSKEEAAARIVTIRAILAALGIATRPVDHGCVIEGRAVGFKAFAATIGGVSGFTAIGFVADELAKWKDKDTGANPAKEVLRSLKPTLATQPRARGFLSSSPFSTIDAHAEAFDRGDTPAQQVAHAPTWTANPTVTEAETRELEPDEPTRLREYAAVPMASGTQHWFDADAIQAAVRPAGRLTPEAGTMVTAGGDLAFVSDSAGLVIGHVLGEWEKARFRVADLLEIQPQPGAPLRPSKVLAAFAAVMKSHHVDCFMADGHYKMTVVEHLDEAGIAMADAPLTVSDPFVRMRVLFNGGRAEIPNHPRLIAQLKAVMWRPTPNNAISIIQPRNSGGHGDLVSALVLAAWQRYGYVIPDAPPPDEDQMAAAIEARLKKRNSEEWWEQ